MAVSVSTVRSRIQVLEIVSRLYCSPSLGATDSPISGIIAELFLQWYENLNIKHYIDNESIVFYTRYVDDIIYDSTKITNQQIVQQANAIHPDLKFDYTMECNNSINFLDITIHRNNTNFDINIYRKPTTTDTIIHFNSNHPFEQKTAAFCFLLNRMHQLPRNQQQKLPEDGPEGPKHVGVFVYIINILKCIC
jgi:hypothetical protein